MMLSLPALPVNTQANLHAVHERITKAARAAGRDPSSVRLLAVSKAFGPDAILNAATAGQRAFGENYVQEAAAKIIGVRVLRPDLAFEWHFIGPIQSNKTRAIADNFAWVQSIERLSIAQRLAEQRAADRPPLNVLLQVNISGEASKSGVAPDEVLTLARAVNNLPRLRMRGLMAIPEAESDVVLQRVHFSRMRQLFGELLAAGVPVDTLSMGMSSDLEAAIAEGSTMVRIGTAIFGERQQRR